MYSEFTVKLINEVKKREVLYNNKYDKRPKADKEKSWDEIGEILKTDPEKCKKHWKNIRDRFVKIKHARDKHFMNNGSELTAPGYIYYDMLQFMTEFSIKKVVTSRESQQIDPHDVIPEPLLLCDNDKIIDMTIEFLHEVKKHPILYDPSAEFRRFRGRNDWKEISDALYSKFTIGKLRHYWSILMKQYKMYTENRHQFFEPIKNENIFNMMSFVVLNQNREDRDDEPIEFITFEENCKIEREDHRNSLVNIINEEEYDETYDNSEGITSQNYDDDDSDEGQFAINHEIFGPEPKKLKFSTASASPKLKKHKSNENLDEYDFFGKKVAMQLRNLAKANQKLSRKAEIEVLQLLMKFEESAE